MTPTLAPTTDGVASSLPLEERIELARYLSEAAYRALEPFEDELRAQAQAEPCRMPRAHYLHQFIQNQRAACADLELDRMERGRWDGTEEGTRA